MASDNGEDAILKAETEIERDAGSGASKGGLLPGKRAGQRRESVTTTVPARVESRLFRDRHFPKGHLNINCEHGMVILRGELDSPLEMVQLEERVRRVPGVRGVQNLVHPHGTPAPNKQRSWAASRVTA